VGSSPHFVGAFPAGTVLQPGVFIPDHGVPSLPFFWGIALSGEKTFEIQSAVGSTSIPLNQGSVHHEHAVGGHVVKIKVKRFEFSEAILKADDPIVWLGKAKALYELGRYKEVMPPVEEAAKLGDPEAREWLERLRGAGY